jgi:glycosyltransferase involved in cell wall biosynthesis
MIPSPVLLSVIIPTYNRENLLRYTLDSLKPEHHPGVSYEIIVVDDGSTDNTWNFVENNYPTVRLVRNNGRGASAGRNTGLRIAEGKYIQYLDSDDITGPGFYRKKLEFLEISQVCHACYGAYDFFTSDGPFNKKDIIFKYKYPMLKGYRNSVEHLANFLGGNFLPPHSIIWQKKFLQKINGHDETLAINQDVELFVRAIIKGLLIEPVDDGTKVYSRNHNTDQRQGDPANDPKKMRQILELRKKIYVELKKNSFDQPACLAAMSSYLFNYWRSLRHKDPPLANAFLAFAQQVYWPIKIEGGAFFRFLSVALGPVRAVQVKYFLLKRD